MGKPVFFRDLTRLRRKLSIAATDRVRVVMGYTSAGVVSGLECVLCEELLEWRPDEKWWVCSGCSQEVTRSEGLELFRACRDYLDEVVREDAGDEDDGKGSGRWLRAARAILNR